MGARIIAHEKLGQALTDRTPSYLTSFADLMGAGPLIGTDIALPDVAVGDMHSIGLGGRTLELKSWQTSYREGPLR